MRERARLCAFSPHNVKCFVDLGLYRSQYVGAQFIEEPGAQNVKPVAEAFIVSDDQLVQRVQKQAEHFGMRIHKHFRKNIRYST